MLMTREHVFIGMADGVLIIARLRGTMLELVAAERVVGLCLWKAGSLHSAQGAQAKEHRDISYSCSVARPAAQGIGRECRIVWQRRIGCGGEGGGGKGDGGGRLGGGIGDGSAVM